jgi:large subunit ribosomal protein L20
MARVRTGVATHRRRKRVLRKAKGFWGGHRRLFRTAKMAVIRSQAYATRDRRMRKRDFRRIWIIRISAACDANGISYSRFVHGLSRANIALNRKMLSEIAIRNPEGFAQLVEKARG